MHSGIWRHNSNYFGDSGSAGAETFYQHKWGKNSYSVLHSEIEPILSISLRTKCTISRRGGLFEWSWPLNQAIAEMRGGIQIFNCPVIPLCHRLAAPAVPHVLSPCPDRIQKAGQETGRWLRSQCICMTFVVIGMVLEFFTLELPSVSETSILKIRPNAIWHSTTETTLLYSSLPLSTIGRASPYQIFYY